MYLSMSRIVVISLLVFLLSGCPSVDQVIDEMITTPAPAPTRPLYVLASTAPMLNELDIVDADTWQVVRRAPLPMDSFWAFSRDPLGRIWMGFSLAKLSASRVQVFTPNGRLLHTLPTCFSPTTIIHFAAGRAFIACEKPMLHLAVNVVDLTSLEIVQQIDIPLEGKSFSLTTTGGNEDYFILVGMGDPSNWIALVDTHTLHPLAPLRFPAANPYTLLTHNGRFLLLNSVAEVSLRKGWVEPLPDGRPDLLIIDTNSTPVLTIYEMVAPGALWGVIVGDWLYTYYDAQRFGLDLDPFRAVSRLNLITNEAELWPLPDNWNARDIAVVDGEIILTHNDNQHPDQSGLFRFDPTTGALTLLVNIPGAQRILAPAE